MKSLTNRQEEVLTFIKYFIKDKKYPPTIREVATQFTISVKGAYDHLKALEKKSVLKCDPNRSRSIEILDNSPPSEDHPVVEIPLLGRVAAGIPLFAEANFDGTVPIPRSYLKSGNYFALLVKGESMTGVGIMDGDIALIRAQSTAENGQIVVAMVEEAVTLKRFYKETSRIRLQAENLAFPPLYSQDVKILGKLSAIIRNYE
ncbi:MAG: repressor LexA [Spirochaetes bacterium GWB1_48_6]|nr:MAG: repressor LexA [Spirochaetes bacterium GWB1_48_6]